MPPVLSFEGSMPVLHRIHAQAKALEGLGRFEPQILKELASAKITAFVLV
jgi:hypothetical protein